MPTRGTPGGRDRITDDRRTGVQSTMIDQLRAALERIANFEDVEHLEPGGNGRSEDLVPCWAMDEIREIAREALSAPTPEAGE